MSSANDPPKMPTTTVSALRCWTGDTSLMPYGDADRSTVGS
jgi:hypothetical protein